MPWRALDDLDTPIRLHRRGLRLALGRPARIVAATLRRPARLGPRAVQAAVRAGWLGRILLLLGTLALLTLIVLLVLREGPMGIWLMTFSPVAVSLLFALVPAAVGLAQGARRLKAAMADAMLGRARCPACAYELTTVRDHAEPAGPSGPAADRVRCPECGAAWKRDRIGRLRPPPPRVVIVR